VAAVVEADFPAAGLAAVAVERFRELPTSKKAKSHHGAAETRRKQGGLPRSPKLPRLPRLKNQEPEILQCVALGRILENSQGIYLIHSRHACTRLSLFLNHR